MAWSSLASNQMVNQDDAVSSPFTLNSGQSHGSGQLCFTKAMALAKYNLDASAMSAYASNQLVPKSSWVAVAPQCAEFELAGGVSGRTFNFTNCNGQAQTVIMPQGDSAPFCIKLPYSAVGATNLGECTW